MSVEKRMRDATFYRVKEKYILRVCIVHVCTPVLLPEKSYGRRSLVGCSPQGHEESDMTERLHFHFHALEKGMATHSSVLAWRIPGTGEPGRLPSMGWHRVGHDCSNLAAANFIICGLLIHEHGYHSVYLCL